MPVPLRLRINRGGRRLILTWGQFRQVGVNLLVILYGRQTVIQTRRLLVFPTRLKPKNPLITLIPWQLMFQLIQSTFVKPRLIRRLPKKNPVVPKGRFQFIRVTVIMRFTSRRRVVLRWGRTPILSYLKVIFLTWLLRFRLRFLAFMALRRGLFTIWRWWLKTFRRLTLMRGLVRVKRTRLINVRLLLSFIRRMITRQARLVWT